METSKNARAARLQTLACDLFAVVQIETSQLCAMGEQLSESGVTHSLAIEEYERAQLAAAFGHLDQARITQAIIATCKQLKIRFCYIF